MSTKFVVSHLDQQLGPFTEEEIKAKWSKGELLPIDYVYDESKKDWILLAEHFPWARKREEAAPPPPMKIEPKKKFPPTPGAVTTQASAVKAQHSKDISEVTQPSIAVPANKEPAVIKLGSAAITMQPTQAKPAPAPAAEPKRIEVPADFVLNKLKPTPIEPLTPVVEETVVMAAQAPAATIVQQPAKQVRLTDGVGEVDIKSLQAGELELLVQGSSLELDQPFKVQVRSAEPVEVTWSFVNQQTVGHEFEVQFRAVDANGNLCTQYSDTFSVKVTGSENREVEAKLDKGEGRVKLTHTKAETWSIALSYAGYRTLRLPPARAFEWQPGPAARLILDGPQELVSGSELKVKVRAVDQYGNLAKTYQGTVTLEVKAS